MSKYIPEVWPFTLLSLAAWRVWKLIATDTILETVVDRTLRQIKDQTRRDYWREFLECPYCLGFHVSLAVWLAWLAWPTEMTIAAVPLAISAVVGLLGTVLNRLSD